MDTGRVGELWRFPVKSMGGATITSARLHRGGLHGDRLWAVRDVEKDMTASARRLPELLNCTARYVRDPGPDAGPGHAPEVLVTVPDGREFSSADPAVHAAVSEVVGREVRLVPLAPADDVGQQRLTARQGLAMSSVANIRRELGIAPGEPMPDLARMRVRDLMTLARYSTPPGTFVDLAPVHVLTRTSLDTIAGRTPGSQLDARRFRPTVLVDLDDADAGSLPEADWAGRRLDVGAASLDVVMPTVRCVVPSRPQPGLATDPAISRAVAKHADRFLGVYADVLREGEIAVGDAVGLRAPTSSALRDNPVTRTFGAGRRTVLRAASAALSRLP